MIPGLLIIGLSSLARQQEVVHAGRNAAIAWDTAPVLVQSTQESYIG